jgi:hypothetical protein
MSKEIFVKNNMLDLIPIAKKLKEEELKEDKDVTEADYEFIERVKK